MVNLFLMLVIVSGYSNIQLVLILLNLLILELLICKINIS